MISSLSALVSLWFFLLLLQHSASDPVVYPSKSKLLSWKPSIIVRGGAFVDEGFLTEEECDHLISLARSELKRSAVADNLSGKNTLSEVRTSSGMFISKGKDPIISGIEDKIAAWTFLPKENGEDIQVLRYEHGQKYDPHFDYFSDEVNIARGSHRITTVLIYLSDVTKGGETVFPSAQLSQREGMLFCSSAFIQMLLQIHLAFTQDVPLWKARNGQLQSGFMWLSLTKSSPAKETAPTRKTIAGGGLRSESAQRIQSTWLEHLDCLAFAGGAATFVRILFCSSLCWFRILVGLFVCLLIEL